MIFLGSSGFFSSPKGRFLTLKTWARFSVVGEFVLTVWFHHMIALWAGTY
jgi:hypothetical protein